MKSKLDLLIEIFQTMSDEEIILATQNNQEGEVEEFALNEYEFYFEEKIHQPVLKDYKKIDNELVNYKFEFEYSYLNMNDFEKNKEVGMINIVAA